MTMRTSAEHLEEMNKVLREHPRYTPDMVFFAVPEGVDPEHATGYSWRCAEETVEKIACFVQVARAVNDGALIIRKYS